MNKMGERINEMLFKRKIVKKHFAKQLNISPHHLNTILNSKSSSTVSMLRNISHLLDVPSDYLLQDFDKKFIIFAIDDYLDLISEDEAISILKDFIILLQKKEENKNE